MNESVALTEFSQQQIQPQKIQHVNPLFLDKLIYLKSPQNNPSSMPQNPPNTIAAQCQPLLTYSKTTSSYKISQQYQKQFLTSWQNAQTIIVSFFGAQKIGKSFLIDSLLTSAANKIVRVMRKHNNSLINTCNFEIKSNHASQCLLYDFSGDLQQQMFLLAYFLSSVVVFSLSNRDRKAELQKFKEALKLVKAKLDAREEDLPPPQLIILLRDTNQQNLQQESITQITSYNLFDQNIQILPIQYPGEQSTTPQRQLPDLPLQKLNKNFLQKIDILLQKIKSSKQKVLKGNYLTTKILPFALEAAVEELNTSSSLNVDRIWDNVVESLSVGYYNHYLTEYQNMLTAQFQEQRPHNKYQLYKKLSKITRNLNKNLQPFKNLQNEPIFEQYKNKLGQIIKAKKQLIKVVNKQKAINQNKRNCQQLLKRIGNQNCGDILDEYCQKGVDEGRWDCFFSEFAAAVEHRARRRTRKTNPEKENTAKNNCMLYEKLLQQLHNRQQKLSKISSLNLQPRIQSLQTKKSQLSSLKQKSTNTNSQLKSQYLQLQQQKQHLKYIPPNKSSQLKSTESLMEQENQRRKALVNKSTKQLDDKLKSQKEKIAALEEELRKLRKAAAPVEPEKKDKGCCCNLM